MTLLKVWLCFDMLIYFEVPVQAATSQNPLTPERQDRAG